MMKLKHSIMQICMSLLLAAGMCSCTKKPEEIRLGDWMVLLADKAGIGGYEETKPYFMNVGQNSPYFDAVQSAVEWGVLTTLQPFNPEEALTKRWTAATLIHLMETELPSPDNTIKDITSDPFNKEISMAVNKGMMSTDRRHMFHPENVMDRNEAIKLLDQTVDYINHPEIEKKEVIEFESGGKLIEERPDTLDKETGEAVFSAYADMNENDVFSDEDGSFYVIDKIENDTGRVHFHELDLLDENNQIEFSGSEDLTFDHAEVEIGEAGMAEERANAGGTGTFVHGKQKTIEVHGYKVVLIYSGSNFSAKATRTLDSGREVYASAALRNVHVDYDWKNKSADTRTFFKVSFDSSENIGSKNTKQKASYVDFREIKASDFVSSLKRTFKKDKEEAKIPICKFHIPVSGNPLVTVCIALNLNISASGNAELNFTQDCEIGAETRNGHTRIIKNVSHQEKGMVHGDVFLGTNVTTSFDLVSGSLMDVGINAGIKGEAEAVVHLYDKDGKKQTQSVDVSADAVEEAASDNPNVLMCADIRAYKSLSLDTNSGDTLLGKLGMGRSFELINGDNSSLIPKISGHFENGHAVKKCTRKDRMKLQETSGIRSGKQIELGQYAMVVKKGAGKSIRITRLPEGYSREDLQFTSEDPAIAAVDANGYVAGLSKGSVLITIRTDDGSFTAGCSVLVVDQNVSRSD